LRRSLAHLANSCQVEIAANGYQAYNELEQRAFDLIIVDFEITGIDSLELVESIEYIDPGVPVILMLNQTQREMWGAARALNANPILRPFKPLIFLRLVDTLLHQQLERYRDLSEMLSNILTTLSKHPAVTHAFLVEDSGQVLMGAGRRQENLLEPLGALAAAQLATSSVPVEQYTQGETLLASDPSQQDHELHVTGVIENMFLALVTAETIPPTDPNQVWKQIGAATQEIRRAFYKNAFHDTESPDEPVAEAARISVPLKLAADPGFSNAASFPEPDQDEVAINWQIITNNSNVLSRLQSILAR
jgi:CheY-like chemotaxis protein